MSTPKSPFTRMLSGTQESLVSPVPCVLPVPISESLVSANRPLFLMHVFNTVWSFSRLSRKLPPVSRPPNPVTVFPNSGVPGSVTRKQLDQVLASPVVSQHSVGVGPVPDTSGWTFRTCDDHLGTLTIVLQPPITGYGVLECGVMATMSGPLRFDLVWGFESTLRFLTGVHSIQIGHPRIDRAIPVPSIRFRVNLQRQTQLHLRLCGRLDELVGSGLSHTAPTVRLLPAHHFGLLSSDFSLPTSNFGLQ